MAIAICLLREFKMYHVGVEIMFYFRAGIVTLKTLTIQHYRYSPG
jgi:hypothetical protein